ncbi:hypothetical protein AB0M29_17500 [Streptomyces sp. NPDC051976]|uniref:hypothetical protein n=1 Tax=Streptomyces sp. NPDC051976 TaxID=3154947 RepID=UPI003443BA61
MPSHHRLRPFAPLLVTVLALSACGASAPRTGALNTGTPNPHPTCRVHQQVLPDSDYTAGAHAAPLPVLEMLRYYTSQRTLPFCDAKPPNPQDMAWSKLYTRLTHP